MALAQGNYERAKTEGQQFETEFGSFQAHFGHLQESDPAVDKLVRECTSLLGRFHAEIPLLERQHEAAEAIARFRSDNVLHFTQQAIAQRNESAMKRYGEVFVPKAEEFLFAYQSYDDIRAMADFRKEVERTLVSFNSIYPTILHEAEVRKVIASIKSQNHLHNLSLGLSQHNADWVYQHGPAFEQEVDRFVATYADSPCQDAQEFITQAQALLERYRTEGPQIHQTQLIDQEISKFKSTNNMHYLQMALNQRNSDSVLNYGPKFEAQFEEFLSLYGFEERASTFVASGKALLDKYHREGPVITWEEEVRRTISQIRNENNVHYLTMALAQRNADQVKVHGPRVEEQLEHLIATCGKNPTKEFTATVKEWTDLVARYKTVGPEVIHEAAVTAVISDFKSTHSVHYLSMALNQRNPTQLEQYGEKFVEQYRDFMALYEHDKYAQMFVKEIKALCDRYHKDGPGILRDEEVQKAIRAVKSTNHMHFLSMYLQQKHHEQVERHGPEFEQEFNDFLGEYSEDKIAAQFVKEGKALLAKYKKEAPILKREEEVRQAISSIKSTNHTHFLSMGLSQRNTETVQTHGPKLQELFDDFMNHYASDSCAQSFVRETKTLLEKYKKEGPVIAREEEVRQAISEFKSHNEIHYLSMALVQKNAQKVQEYGPPLEERFAQFTPQFGADLSAQPFIREAKALLEKYRREGPKIIRQDQVEQAIKEIKNQNHMHQLGVALNQKNVERAEEHGVQFENQVAAFQLQYSNDACAKAFIADAQKLLARFREMCPPCSACPSSAMAYAQQPAPYASGPAAYPAPCTDSPYGSCGSAPAPTPVYPLSAPAPYPHQQPYDPAAAYSRPPVPSYGLPPAPYAQYPYSQSPQPQPQEPLSFPSPGPQYADASQYFAMPDPGMFSNPAQAYHSSPSGMTPPTAYHEQSQPQQQHQPQPQQQQQSWSPASHHPQAGQQQFDPASSTSSSPSFAPPAPAQAPVAQPQAQSPAAPAPTAQADDGGYFEVPGAVPAPFPGALVKGGREASPQVEGQGQEEKRKSDEDKAQEKFKEIRFDELHIISKIGSGSYGTVYKAWWRGTIVAVKKLDDAADMTSGMVELFKKEAAAMTLLSHHPSLANFVGACCELPNVCVVSQYYRFGSLESVLRGPTRADLPWKAFVKMAKETAAGIHHLHKEGILHSRIASRNILVGDGCRAYVNDFAFCHFKPKEQVYAQSATQTFLGPVRYMSPEAMMHKFSEGSDAWAFGVLLWELWERKEPFEGDDELTVAFKVAQDKQTLPISPSCPEVVAKLMRDCWQERASQRPSFTAMLDILDDYFATL